MFGSKQLPPLKSSGTCSANWAWENFMTFAFLKIAQRMQQLWQLMWTGSIALVFQNYPVIPCEDRCLEPLKAFSGGVWGPSTSSIGIWKTRVVLVRLFFFIDVLSTAPPFFLSHPQRCFRSQNQSYFYVIHIPHLFVNQLFLSVVSC